MSLRRQLASFAITALAALMATAVRAQNSSSSSELDKLLDNTAGFGPSRPMNSPSRNHQTISAGPVTRRRMLRAPPIPISLSPGLRIWETLARFEHGTLKELTLSLYNRGDAGTMHEDEFLRLLASIDQSVTAWSG